MKDEYKLKIKPQTKNSTVLFFDSLKPELFTENAFYIFDTNTEKLFLNTLKPKAYITIQAGEQAKTLETVQAILQKSLQLNLTRETTFYAIGGGVVCDIAAFCASIFKRGAKLSLVPTTLLAMVDASIGGKTAFDFAGLKNSLGSFYLPESIYIFFETLNTLPQSEYKSGLAEILKIGLLKDKTIINLLEKNAPEEFLKSSDTLKALIKKAITQKLKIVQKDFTDSNLRNILNYGHTFAHGLEAISNYTISHGEAVAWGIAQATTLSLRKGLTTQANANRTINLLKKFNYETEFFPKSFNIFSNLKADFSEKLLFYMQNDKKNSTNKIKLILQKKINSYSIVNFSKEELLSEIVNF